VIPPQFAALKGEIGPFCFIDKKLIKFQIYAKIKGYSAVIGGLGAENRKWWQAKGNV
jgi:hypothetical protein